MRDIFDLSELIDAVATKTGLTQKAVDTVLETAILELRTNVINTGRAQIHNLGTFNVKVRKARTGTAFGHNYTVPERHAVKFNPSESWKEAHQDATGKELIS